MQLLLLGLIGWILFWLMLPLGKFAWMLINASGMVLPVLLFIVLICVAVGRLSSPGDQQQK